VIRAGVEHGPVFELGVERHQAVTRQLEVEDVGFVALGEQTGLHRQLAAVADVLLQRQRGRTGLALLTDQHPLLERDRRAHRVVVRTQ
jgi:hypothetical protein